MVFTKALLIFSARKYSFQINFSRAHIFRAVREMLSIPGLSAYVRITYTTPFCFIGHTGIRKGLKVYYHQNKGAPRARPTNGETRARNFNKTLIIYSQQQLRAFTTKMAITTR